MIKLSKRVKRKKRDNVISFVVSAEEKQSLVDAAFDSDMSLSDYCRKILFGSKILVSEDVRGE